MAGPVRKLSQSVSDLWRAITGRTTPPSPNVVLHDPAANRAHDLDDPYFDNKVQSRMAEVIADAGQPKSSTLTSRPGH
jgi:hypothetical protein